MLMLKTRCKACGKLFVWDVKKDAETYGHKKLSLLSVCCPECRRKADAEKEKSSIIEAL